MDRHPEASLTLYDRPPGTGLELLREGKVDLAIALESQIPSHFRSYWWRMGHFTLMLPKGHELVHIPHPTLEQIARYPFMKLFSNVRYAATNKIESAFFDRGLAFKLFLEAGNIHLIAEYVRRGLGISMVLSPEEGLDLFAGQLDFVRLDHLFPPESVRICCRKEAPLSSLGRFFLDTVLEGVVSPASEDAK
jgi:DNA-binding transcriptional LysR family regulator